MDKNGKQIITMDYRGEAIECVKGNVLQMHKQIYAKYYSKSMNKRKHLNI